MRVKKAAKQLSKAVNLIGAVATRYRDADSHLKELLKSASAAAAQARSALTQAPRRQVTAPPSQSSASPSFAGSKTDFIRSVIESRGTSGATPKDIDQAFTARRIARSKNLIYNSLGALVKQNKIAKKGDRYVLASPATKPAAPAKSAPATKSATPTKSAPVATLAKSAPPAKKTRISPEGLKRIIEANKKRWAAKKAAAARKAPAKKVAAR